jgi:hypothetical protein
MANHESEFDTTKPEQLTEWCVLTENRLLGIAETVRNLVENLEQVQQLIKLVGDVSATVAGVLDWKAKTEEALGSCVDLVESLSNLAARSVKEYAALEARVARLEKGR